MLTDYFWTEGERREVAICYTSTKVGGRGRGEVWIITPLTNQVYTEVSQKMNNWRGSGMGRSQQVGVAP